jgi:hypothetical protein
VNELTGETDPVAQLIDFAHSERNVFHAINQFRIERPGCVKASIIPDIVLFVNGIPLVVVEAKIGDANTANPILEAFVQLLRYRNARPETLTAAGCARARRASSTRTCSPAERRPSSALLLRVTNISMPGRTSGRRAAAPTPVLWALASSSVRLGWRTNWSRRSSIWRSVNHSGPSGMRFRTRIELRNTSGKIHSRKLVRRLAAG